jgi:thiomorpholine-carboxylate dehydrogenase
MVDYYTEDQIAEVLTMKDLFPAMEKALIAFSAGEVVQPVRAMLPVRNTGGIFANMPAVTADAMGTKMVTFYPENAGTGIDTHQAVIALFDPATGSPLALMDGGLITEMRTAAVSAVATNLMAAPEARSLAILGSGVQARSHLAALNEVRIFDDVRIWSRTPEHAKAFAQETGARAMSAEDAVRGADVVVTVTSSKTPVLKGDWLKDGAHVNAVGACAPNWRELDDDVMKNVIVADSIDAARQESGDIILSGAAIHGELGAMLAGKIPAEVGSITIFKSLGLAVEDVAAAWLVHERMKS